MCRTCREQQGAARVRSTEAASALLIAGRWSPVIGACRLYMAMALAGAARKSGTFDEFVHVTAGRSYWAYGDYRLNPENGNWPQRWVGLPSVLEGAAFPSLSQRSREA